VWLSLTKPVRLVWREAEFGKACEVEFGVWLSLAKPVRLARIVRTIHNSVHSTRLETSLPRMLYVPSLLERLFARSLPSLQIPMTNSTAVECGPSLP